MTARPSGPESAAHNITAMRGRIHGIAGSNAQGDDVHPDALEKALDALVAAVRRHDAEIVRDLPYKPGADTLKDAWKDGRDTAADAIEETR